MAVAWTAQTFDEKSSEEAQVTFQFAVRELGGDLVYKEDPNAGAPRRLETRV